MDAFNKFKRFVVMLYLALFTLLSIVTCTKNEPATSDAVFLTSSNAVKQLSNTHQQLNK
ncbi:MAG: hypothetical protein HOO85_06605 [Methylotenera sp.]|nr:hypothetical protein [Methylotenera sp.]